MRLQPVELLANVGSNRKQRRLLMQSRRIEGVGVLQEARELLLQPRANCFGLARRRRVGLRGEDRYAVEPLTKNTPPERRPPAAREAISASSASSSDPRILRVELGALGLG